MAQANAGEVEHGLLSGVVGAGVGRREILRGRQGLQPVRPQVVRRLNGEACGGPNESLQCWRDHFEGILRRETYCCVITVEGSASLMLSQRCLFAKIIHCGLQKVVEETVPDSQCGYVEEEDVLTMCEAVRGEGGAGGA